MLEERERRESLSAKKHGYFYNSMDVIYICRKMKTGAGRTGHGPPESSQEIIGIKRIHRQTHGDVVAAENVSRLKKGEKIELERKRRVMSMNSLKVRSPLI